MGFFFLMLESCNQKKKKESCNKTAEQERTLESLNYDS